MDPPDTLSPTAMGLAENRGVPAADGSYLVDLGGADAVLVGRACRCGRSNLPLLDRFGRRSVAISWATMGINLSGALLLGFFLAVALGHLPVSVMTPIAVGLIGGFTTFSTFAWEAFTMSRTGRTWPAAIYVAVSVIGGLLAAWAGYSTGRAVH
jgi:protein CrcB